jgi:pimeloyl-ACP methyl ester carboxylesterase
MITAGKYGEYIRSLVVIGGQTELDEQTMEITRDWAPGDRLPTGFQEALARSHGDPYWRQLVTDYVDTVERLFNNGGDFVGEYLSQIACPTLIVQGENDPWVNPTHSRRLSESILGSELELFPEAGHEVQRDQPKAFNARMLRFLSSY